MHVTVIGTLCDLSGGSDDAELQKNFVLRVALLGSALPALFFPKFTVATLEENFPTTRFQGPS
jgi:hypothetical protein